MYGSAGLCSPDISIFARPKMITPSWPKVAHPFTDGDNVASCGLSLGLLSASLFQDRQYNGPSLIAMKYCSIGIGEPEGDPREHKFTTAHALWSGARNPLHISVSLVFSNSLA